LFPRWLVAEDSLFSDSLVHFLVEGVVPLRIDGSRNSVHLPMIITATKDWKVIPQVVATFFSFALSILGDAVIPCE
jgi:hypothetical protein